MASKHKIRKHCFAGLESVALLLSSLMFVPGLSQAQVGFTLATGLEYIENPLRQGPSDDIDYLSSTTASIVMDRQTKRFGTTLNYSANRQEYRYDIRNDQGIVNGLGIFTFKAIPNVFSWQVTNARFNELVDASLPDIPDNRQDINTLTTGPVINLPINAVTLMGFSSQHGIVSFEQTDTLEQDRHSYNFYVSRIVSRLMQASLRASYTESQIDAIPGSDYTFLNLSASLEFNTDDYSLSAELGQYSTERLGLQSDNPIYVFSGAVRVNSRLELTADFAQQVDDLVSDLRGPGPVDQFFEDSDRSLGATFGNSNQPNLYERESINFGATYAVDSAFSLDVRYTNNQRTSIGFFAEEDDESISANLGLPLPAQTRLTMAISATKSKRNFSIRGLQDRDDFRVSGRYRLADRIGLTFFMAEVSQTADFELDNYDGLAVGVGLEYAR